MLLFIICIDVMLHHRCLIKVLKGKKNRLLTLRVLICRSGIANIFIEYKMGKTPKINSFFKRANVSPTEENVGSSVDHVTIDTPSPPTKIQRIDTVEFDINSLERDPGLRRKIWEYPVNRRDEVRRAYITLHGPNRPDLGKKYPYTLASAKARPRRFQAPWFALFSWLEYSVAKNKAFCFPCFLFAPPDGSSFAGHSAFVVEGFDGWRKVNSGKTCSFRLHEGVNSDSCHRTAEHKWKEIQNPTQNIERVTVKFSAEQVFNNRIRLKISIDLVRRLAFQAMPFRGHDEKPTSNNRGNFLELYDL